MNSPLISVVMPFHNNEETIKESIESILTQTEKDFEFIIIDDSSTDKSRNIVESFNDKRIILINNNRTKGQLGARNTGIIQAKGKYIAVMDADDISECNRFEEELKEINKGYDLVGCIAQTIGDVEKFERKTIGKEMNDAQIKTSLFYGSPIIHPSVLIKTDILKNNLYNEDLVRGADYELWTRIMNFTKMKMIGKRYHLYRVWNKQVSNTDKEIGEKSYSETNTKINSKIKGNKLLYFLKNYGFDGFKLGLKNEIYKELKG